jgi:hypothetical protein
VATELKERFALADEVGAPELWSEARRRAAAPEASPRALERPPGAARRAAIGALAFAVFAAAAVFAWQLSHPKQAPKPPRPVAVEPVDLAAELGPGWTELPAPPEVRSGAATAWTGSQLLVWGGYVFEGSGDKPASDDGFLFDGASRSWRSLPPSPLSGRSLAASAWTGREFLVWGGADLNTYPYESYADGAAFDPSTGRWRTLPLAPIDGRAPMSVWTGKELIVWGTAVRVDDRPRDGAAYNPTTDTWRRIAEASIELTDATAVWTGDEMLVFGAALHGGNVPETETAVGAAYDPKQDTWRELPPSELSPQASTAAWTGREMVVWDYLNGTAAYDPTTDTWRELPRVPIDDYECTPQSVAIPGQAVFGNYCGITPAFSVTKDRWRDVSRENFGGWVLEPVAAGSAVLVLGHGLELSDVPGQEFDTTMLAWVPPDASETGGVEDPAPFVPLTEVVGDETRMPVVFPDGSRATLVFPSELSLEDLGVQPDVSYVSKDESGPRYPIVFLHDPKASLATYVAGSEPISTTEAGAEIWAMSAEWESNWFYWSQHEGVWLRIQLEAWTVLVSSTSVEDAVQVADHLRIRQTPSGFPVVDAAGPLELPEFAGESQGPELSIGDANPDPWVDSDRTVILLSPDGCVEEGIDTSLGYYGSTCLGEGEIRLGVYGTEGFVSNVVQELRAEDFVQA